MTPLLTTSNPKTLKGEAHGYLTAILHLAPASTAGLGSVCPWSTDGCRDSCLNTAGRAGIIRRGESSNAILEARIRRTRLFFGDRPAFISQLADELDTHRLRAHRLGLKPAARLNGTSDLAWEKLAPQLFRGFPTVQFYDYTKGVARAWNQRLPDNYHLTFSRSEQTPDATVRAALQAGISVAVPYGEPLTFPSAYRKAATVWGAPYVIDGDLSDLRFLDKPGSVVLLKAKGKAKRDTTGFVWRGGRAA